MPRLVVIYGAPFSGKSVIARALATSMPGKSAIVSVDGLLRDAIAVPDIDGVAEVEMVHTQMRLLVANYLKNGYDVVVEGAFAYARDGQLDQHEREIDQLLGLMRNLAREPLLVRLSAGEGVLRSRAADAGFDESPASLGAIDASYRARRGPGSLTLNTGEMGVDEAVEAIREALGLADSS